MKEQPSHVVCAPGFSAVLSLTSHELLITNQILREGVSRLTNHDQAAAARAVLRKIQAVWYAEQTKPPADYATEQESETDG